MADAVLSGLVSDVMGKLSSLAFNEFRLVWGFKDDVSTLKDYFNQIQAVLHDAEKRRNNEETVELWLKRLRSESLKMENVFDEVSTEAMLRKLHKKLGIKYRVRAFFSSSHNQLMFRLRIAHKVKDIRKKIADISAQRSELNLTRTDVTVSVDVDAGVGGEMPNRETSSLVHSSFLFGRNEETEMIVEQICNNDVVGRHDNPSDVRVFAIWGMGGLGKTTLAQLVYNHERVDEHFELKCWIYVSENFQVKELLKGIIESIDKCTCGISVLDSLQVYLQDKLRGKRFLIVFDDVWIEDSEKEKWEKLSKTLSCGAKGSFVVMTTRSKATSRMMAKVPDLQHELGCLSRDASWSLFEKLAFAEGREGGDIMELEPIGKKIVEKCSGLPLALRTLGSLMWSKTLTSEWEYVLESDIWELQENDILPALQLSYDNLLPHLKQCFAYCCLFPKGYKMKKKLLILLWMTNGLIPTRGKVDWYVLGEEIINCLLWRSFFQIVNEHYQIYKMHDLLHDLAQYVMRDNCLVIEPGKEFITPKEVLHLSSSYQDLAFSDQDLMKLRSLRSVIMFKAYEGSINNIFNLGYLRVLYLVELRSTTLPESICKLKYLKYLNLSSSAIRVLPKSIIYLQNLQVLILVRCLDLRTLPEGMGYMTNLQHLNIKKCYSLKCMPVGIKELTHLRILPYFRIAKKKGAKIEELGEINLLEGKLWISGLKNVKGLRECKNAILKCKRNLLVLKLQWQHYLEEPEAIARDEEVLERLEPNPSLKGLKIIGCMGKITSLSWIVKLKNLDKVSFYGCTNCEQIPSLGKLPRLRSIKLKYMDALKCFHDDDNANSRDNVIFPYLQELYIAYCPNLVFLPGNFPNLKKLVITDCNSLCSLPDKIQSFKDINELHITECKNISRRYEEETGVDWPKISHIPYIYITPISSYEDEEE